MAETLKEYLGSKEWRNKSAKILRDKEVCCNICGRPRWKWQPRKKQWKRMLRFAVHHIRYTNVPNEKREDFMVLCYMCHDFFHTIHRLKNVSPVYNEVYEWSKDYFFYEGAQTFVGY